ncbi:hypothetical protein ACFWIA_20625 [Streptomyces sp. NPDC127068]|uniref:hypothetical protein n=1 Tax=Streptomyces sp. NPDC127068 TaxID=3347127 RepID=UPI00366752D6
MHQVPDPAAVVKGPAFVDSWLIFAGGLFVAFDGGQAGRHDFTSQAVAAGAAGVLASRPVARPVTVLLVSGRLSSCRPL